MIKKILALGVSVSLISAGLLFLGTTVMGKTSPALASTHSPLVVRSAVPRVSVDNPVVTTTLAKAKQQNETNKSESVPTVESTSAPVANSEQSPTSQPVRASVASVASVTSVSTTVPITTVTIAQLLSNPALYIHKVFTLTGVATKLSSDKFLLNDGTGRFVVEVDDDRVKYVVTDGMTITVTGEFDENSSSNGYELDACTLTDMNGTVIIDNCQADHGSDDCTTDGCSDDCSDDCTGDGCSDDCSDDCTTVGCTDDSSDDCTTDGCSDDKDDITADEADDAADHAADKADDAADFEEDGSDD